MNKFVLVWFYEKELLVKIQGLFIEDGGSCAASIFWGEEVRKHLRTTIQ